MNGTPGLLAKSAAFLAKHPVVWLPVLAARGADALISFACGAARGPAMMAVAPRSVLGGVAGKANGAVLLVGSILTWLPSFCEAALLIYGMVVCARWAHALRESDGATAQRSWSVPFKPVARVAAMTFAVSAITVSVGLFLCVRSGVPLQWAPMIAACFFLMSAWFLMPSWLRLVAETQGTRVREVSRTPPFLAFLASFIVVAAITAAGAALQRSLAVKGQVHNVFALFLVSLFASCLSSWPLAFSFLAMSRYAADRPGWQSDWSGEA